MEHAEAYGLGVHVLSCIFMAGGVHSYFFCWGDHWSPICMDVRHQSPAEASRGQMLGRVF